MTLDQLLKTIRIAEPLAAQLEQSFKTIQSLEDGPQKVFIEAVNDWFELDKEQIVSLYKSRVDAATSEVKKLQVLQSLLNKTLQNALNGTASNVLRKTWQAFA